MTDQDQLKFLKLIAPEKDFTEEDAPLPPDYSNIDSWAAKPSIDGPQFYVPSTEYTVNKDKNDIDVFYIHPTGFFETAWNFNMDKNRSAYERTEIMLANQVSAFNESCNIFAPEYRQATYYSFFDKNSNGIKALDLAYKDVANAFDYYIENENNGKPFIIAGHSQGALHAQRLIKNKILNKDLNARFICAYIIGYIIPEIHYEDLFEDIKRSDSFNDTNCIISWSTVVEGFTRNREKTPYWTSKGWDYELMRQKIVATNPFSWTNNSSWHKDIHNKAIINRAENYDFNDRFRIEHTGCKKSIGLTKVQDFETSLNKNSGLLETRGSLINKFKKMKFFNGDLHSFDMMLFWGSLRNNIKDRINAFK